MTKFYLTNYHMIYFIEYVVFSYKAKRHGYKSERSKESSLATRYVQWLCYIHVRRGFLSLMKSVNIRGEQDNFLRVRIDCEFKREIIADNTRECKAGREINICSDLKLKGD